MNNRVRAIKVERGYSEYVTTATNEVDEGVGFYRFTEIYGSG